VRRWMRWGRVITLAGVAGFLVAGRASAGPHSSPQEAIRAVLKAQAAAWNRGDVEGFMAGYWKSEDTTFVGASDVVRGWQGVLDRYRRNYPDRSVMGQLTFADLEIDVLSKDFAYIVGRWQLEREKDQPGGVFTLIARRFPQGWRIIHDHTTAFPAPAASVPH
jgi:uncharacterized protein (TIGR02246 family)